jgi:hypothetical protein
MHDAFNSAPPDHYRHLKLFFFSLFAVPLEPVFAHINKKRQTLGVETQFLCMHTLCYPSVNDENVMYKLLFQVLKIP